MHPDIARDFANFPLPPDDLSDVTRLRLVYDEHFRKVAERSPISFDGVLRETSYVKSRQDGHQIPLRIYRPDGVRQGSAGLLFVHGGAFILDDYEEGRCVAFARDAGLVVVAVDYRLSPEHRFPIPLEDVYSALEWMSEHTAELSISAERIGISGCSSGGTLAASATHRVRDENGPSLALQLLLYPVLDATLDTPSLKAQGGAERRDTIRMWEYYFGGPWSQPPANASPSSQDDFTGLPRTGIVAAELDDHRDEAIEYGVRLLEAGVSVDLHVWADVPHAFDLFVPDAGISVTAIAQQCEFLRRSFEL